MADTTFLSLPPRRDPILSRTAYPAVRLSMSQDHVMIDDAAIESLLSDLFPGSHPDDVENFAQAFRNVTKTVAPIAQRALPGAIQGASTGMMVGGPYGALFGALGGGAISALSGSSQAQQPSQTTTPPAQPAAVPTPTRAHAQPVSAPFRGPTTAVPSAGVAASQAAAAQLLALLSRPETLQALMALAMQAQGRRTVTVGSARVPARALANALSDLAAIAGRVEEAVQDGLSDETDNGTTRFQHNIAILEAFAAAPWPNADGQARPQHNRRHQ